MKSWRIEKAIEIMIIASYTSYQSKPYARIVSVFKISPWNYFGSVVIIIFKSFGKVIVNKTYTCFQKLVFICPKIILINKVGQE